MSAPGLRGREHYEYQVVSAQGVGYPSPTLSRARCVGRLAALDAARPMRAPHRVQRRRVLPWEDEPYAAWIVAGTTVGGMLALVAIAYDAHRRR